MRIYLSCMLQYYVVGQKGGLCMKIDKFQGCLIGGAIGDALGYQIEFKKNIQNKEITRYKNNFGVISDDTQMTLFTANGLIWRENRLALRGIAMPPDIAVYYAYLDWLETQNKLKVNLKSNTWLKKIAELRVERAPGLTCLSALSSGKMGTLGEPINDSKGCGGVMRVAPVGLYARNPEIAGEFGAKIAAITHGHIFSSLSSYLFSAMINILKSSECKMNDALNQSLILTERYFKSNKLCQKKEIKEFSKIINLAVELSAKEIEDTKAITMIGEGWVAEEALAIAIYSCLKYQDNFESVVICAVNHDGDSDSTGAIAGNIIGTYLGYDKIPSYYIDNLELKDVILEVADDLSVPIPVSEYNSNNDKYWLSKYVACERNSNF